MLRVKVRVYFRLPVGGGVARWGCDSEGWRKGKGEMGRRGRGRGYRFVVYLQLRQCAVWVHRVIKIVRLQVRRDLPRHLEGPAGLSRDF
jgi:hypothetical protein